jgi:hypothetical protein
MMIQRLSVSPRRQQSRTDVVLDPRREVILVLASISTKAI